MLIDNHSHGRKKHSISDKISSLLKWLTICFSFILLLNGCTAPNYVWPAYDKISLYADLDVNPDDNERPSPIQVKVYELAARTTFDNLDFQGLFNNGTAQLSDELISEKTFFIQPNETISHKIELNKSATHIAIVAAYRKIDSARWKYIYPVKSYGYYKHSIEFTSNAVEIRKSERSKHSEENERSGNTNTKRKDRGEKTLPNHQTIQKTKKVLKTN